MKKYLAIYRMDVGEMQKMMANATPEQRQKGMAEWETWTGMKFPVSGNYVVPNALQPVRIDREADLGEYYDPNVWMKHPV